MAPLRDWPEWTRYTLTAAAGVAFTLVSVTLVFGDVRRDASDARVDSKAALTQTQEIRERLVRLEANQQHMDGKIDLILQRLK